MSRKTRSRARPPATSARSGPPEGSRDGRPPERAAPERTLAPPEPFTAKEKVIAAAILLAIYAIAGTWGQFDFSTAEGYFSLYGEALLHGRLHIGISPEQTYLQDMIPYEGRYYPQWGPVPALPHAAAKLFGLTLSDRISCLLAGWLTALVFLHIVLRLRRRFFPNVSNGACRWFFFAFGLGTAAVLVSLRAIVYHESIVVSSLFVMSGFWAFLRYLETPTTGWAAASGGLLALAVGSRVLMALYGAAAGLALLWRLWQRRSSLRVAASHALAYGLPLALAAGTLMTMNYVRFGSPWDYGNNYLPDATPGLEPFESGRVLENLRHYLLAPVEFTGDFPWIEHRGWRPLENTKRAEEISSLFLASPFLLFGFFAVRLWGKQTAAPEQAVLRTYAAAAALSAAAVFTAMLFFVAASRRYTHDFVPVWMIVAFIGFAAYQHRLPWERLRPAAWGVLAVSALLHLHLTFYQSFAWGRPDTNAMKTFVALSPALRHVLPSGPRWTETEAVNRNDLGAYYMNLRRYEAAEEQFERALALRPEDPRIKRNLELARRFTGGG